MTVTSEEDTLYELTKTQPFTHRLVPKKYLITEETVLEMSEVTTGPEVTALLVEV